MMDPVALLVPDPRKLLRLGHEMWASSPAWTLTKTEDGKESVVGVVRPGLQWVDDTFVAGSQILVREDVACVRGPMLVLPLVGWNADRERIERVLGGRWLTVPAASWLRERDHSALGWFAKGLGNYSDGFVELLDVAEDGGDVTARLRTDAGLLLIHRSTGGGTRFIECECVERPGWTLHWTFEDAPVDVPSPTADELMSLPDLLVAIGRKPRRAPQGPRRVTVKIFPPVEPGDQWCVHSDNLARALGVEAGWEAQALALQSVAEHRPDIVHLVEGDSYDTTFSAYVPDETTARTLAAVLRNAAQDG